MLMKISLAFDKWESSYQSSFKASGKVIAATHDQHGFVKVKLFGELGNQVINSKDFLDLICQSLQALNNLYLKREIF